LFLPQQAALALKALLPIKSSFFVLDSSSLLIYITYFVALTIMDTCTCFRSLKFFISSHQMSIDAERQQQLSLDFNLSFNLSIYSLLYSY